MIVKTTFGKCLATSILFKKHSRMHLMKLVVRVGKSYNVNIEKMGKDIRKRCMPFSNVLSVLT